MEQNLTHFSTKTIPSRMQAWCFYRYGENNVPILDNVDVRTSLKPNEVLVQVKAASLNPIDAMIPQGFGSVLFKSLRKINKSELTDFPVILGRDFSGVVVKTGAQVTRVSEGDEVILCDGLVWDVLFVQQWGGGVDIHIFIFIVGQNTNYMSEYLHPTPPPIIVVVTPQRVYLTI